jgi:hypothetical protein
VSVVVLCFLLHLSLLTTPLLVTTDQRQHPTPKRMSHHPACAASGENSMDPAVATALVAAGRSVDSFPKDFAAALMSGKVTTTALSLSPFVPSLSPSKAPTSRLESHVRCQSTTVCFLWKR